MNHAELSDKLVQAIGLTEAPIGIYYSDTAPADAFSWCGGSEHFCLVGRLRSVRNGTPLAVDGEMLGCMGSAFYLGFNSEIRPGFEYFLSHDAEGKGERFKKTPELALELLKARQFVPAKARYCIFQRLADIPDDIRPDVVAVFADEDKISALVWLAQYDRGADDGVIVPFSAGCGSIVNAPLLQADRPEPKCVLGMTDPAARTRMEKGFLTLSAPFARFVEMVENIPGSFLEVEPWTKLKNR